MEKLKLDDIDKPDFEPNEIQYKKVKDFIDTHNIKFALKDSPNYHYKMFTVRAAPGIIYYMWDISILNRNILGIVWPRKNTEYGKNVLHRLFDRAINYDFVTISWLAPGIDTISHQESISKKIPTIAILWWGFNYYLNSARRELIYEIVANWWLVISEFKINFQPTRYSFPQRNRLIAGLCDMLFLPEASQKSGSLITANYALGQKKPTWVAPNQIFEEQSKGTNELLQDKNTNILTDFDIMLSTHFDKCDKKITPNIQISKVEKDIISQIAGAGEIDIAGLSAQLWKNTQTIMQYITMLEINNLVYQKENWNYSCC